MRAPREWPALPRGLAWTVRRIVKEPYANDLLDDLDELATERLAEENPWHVWLWCWIQVARPSTFSLGRAYKRTHRGRGSSWTALPLETRAALRRLRHHWGLGLTLAGTGGLEFALAHLAG